MIGHGPMVHLHRLLYDLPLFLAQGKGFLKWRVTVFKNKGVFWKGDVLYTPLKYLSTPHLLSTP